MVFILILLGCLQQANVHRRLYQFRLLDQNVIADNIGDNVGDIAGMGSDLFGSYAGSSCATLVVASLSSFGINHEFTAMLYLLLISSIGIIVCLITTLFATDFFEIKNVDQIEPALKNQLIISTALMTVGIAVVSWIALPSSFTIFNFGVQIVVKNWELFFCVAIGLWAGLVIGFITEYYTSNAYSPVQDVADSCRTGAAKLKLTKMLTAIAKNGMIQKVDTIALDWTTCN